MAEENIKIDTVEEHFKIHRKIYIWNTFGELKNLYALADFCFVGASLIPLGGQNFLEPLVYGTKVYTGEHLKNFLWVFEKKPDLRESLLEIVASAQDLEIKLSLQIQDFNSEKAEEEKKARKNIFAQWIGKSIQYYE